MCIDIYIYMQYSDTCHGLSAWIWQPWHRSHSGLGQDKYAKKPPAAPVMCCKAWPSRSQSFRWVRCILDFRRLLILSLSSIVFLHATEFSQVGSASTRLPCGGLPRRGHHIRHAVTLTASVVVLSVHSYLDWRCSLLFMALHCCYMLFMFPWVALKLFLFPIGCGSWRLWAQMTCSTDRFNEFYVARACTSTKLTAEETQESLSSSSQTPRWRY